MGRKTFESIVARLGHTLPNRRNVVVTRQENLDVRDAEIIHDVDDIHGLAGDVFVIGGAELYKQTIGMADELIVTEIHANIDGDVTFPEIDVSWREVSREQHKSDDRNEYDYDFVTYRRT